MLTGEDLPRGIEECRKQVEFTRRELGVDIAARRQVPQLDVQHPLVERVDLDVLLVGDGGPNTKSDPDARQ